MTDQDFDKLKSIIEQLRKDHQVDQESDDLELIFSDKHHILEWIHHQRAINKIMKILYYDIGLFSYQQLYMAVANIAREDSIRLRNPLFNGSDKVWFDRYRKLRDHLKKEN